MLFVLFGIGGPTVLWSGLREISGGQVASSCGWGRGLSLLVSLSVLFLYHCQRNSVGLK